MAKYDFEPSVCERCGKESKIRFPRIYEACGKCRATVDCISDKCRHGILYRSRKEVIEAWNRRDEPAYIAGFKDGCGKGFLRKEYR